MLASHLSSPARRTIVVALLAFAWVIAHATTAHGAVSGKRVFEYTGAMARFTVPADVHYVTVDVQGGQGGGDSHTGSGGRGGGARGVVAVDPGQDIEVWVGQAGVPGGGWGWAHGGAHGEDDGNCDDGAPGAGASAVAISGQTIAVGGGGGGGGGSCHGKPGGGGGDGGDPGLRGGDGWGASQPNNGTGGCGGCASWIAGTNGHDTTGIIDGGAGGGGGGGFPRGGEGGHDNSDPWGGHNGGGGGGGGDSYLIARATGRQIYTSPRSGNGLVVISWGAPPAAVRVESGDGSQALVGSLIDAMLGFQAVDANGTPLGGVDMTLTVPSSGPSGLFFDRPGTTWTGKTGDNGMLYAPTLYSNAVAGPWTLEASVAGVAEPARLRITNIAGTSPVLLSASSSPATRGQPVTFTARLGGCCFVPSGSMRFTVDGVPWGPTVQADPVSETFTSTPISTLALGDHTVEARYGGDAARNPSSHAITLRVEQAHSTTTVTSTRNPAGFGDDVAFRAVVKSAITPTGTVQFRVDGTPLGAPVPVAADGSATSPIVDDLALGAHAVTASYSGDADIAASTGSMTQSIGAAATAVHVSAAQDPVVAGSPLDLTAEVVREAPGVDPTGPVTFELDGSPICTAVPLVNARATCSLPAITGPGARDVRVDFPGDAEYEPSAGRMTVTVLPAPTRTTITATPAAAEYGLPTAVSARVAAADAATPVTGGSVHFTVDGAPIGPPVPVGAGGEADAGELGTLGLGVHEIEAEYLPDADHRASHARTTHHVETASTRLALASSANPAGGGTTPRFTATVDAWTPGLQPTGTVRFFADGQPIGGPVALDGAGTASAPATLAPGSHAIEAHLVPSGPFRASSGTLTQVVGAAPSSGGGGGGGGSAPSGSGEGGVPDRPAPPPALPPLTLDPVAPTATVTPADAVVDGAGTTRLPVACSGPIGERCTGRLTVRGTEVLGSRLVSIPAGTTTRLALDLSRAGERALSSRARVPATATVGAGPSAELTLHATRAPRLRVRKTARLGRDGTLSVHLRCAAARCAGELTLLDGRREVGVRDLVAHRRRWTSATFEVSGAGRARLRLRATTTVRVGLARTHVTRIEVRRR